MIRRRPLAAAVGQALPVQQQGFGLLGIIVTAALGFAVLGVAYTVYHQGELSADVASAAASAREIARRVQAAYASAPNFDLLNNRAMSHDRLWPGCPPVLPSQVNNPPPCPVPMNPWGAAVQVAGTASGFAVTDEQVPSASCVRLVAASATGWAGITVNGTSVMQGRAVQPSVASTLCNQTATATVQFLGGQAAGGSMPVLTPCVPGAPQTQMVACPVAGQISSVPPYGPDGLTQTRTGFCNGAYGAPGWTPWQTVADTCVPACVAPAPSVTPQSQNVPASALCPGGQTGSDTWTQAQSRTQTVTYACATPVAPLTTNPATYTPWVNSGGRIGEVNTCAPMCSTILGTPPWAPQSQTVGAPGSCPPGQVATGSWTQNQTRTASCANPTAATDPVWGAWTNSGPATGTCTPACTVPAPQTQTGGCPAGQTGSISQRRDASCPAPTGPATWGAWYQTGSTCTTPAPPPPPAPSPCFTPKVAGVSMAVGGEPTNPNGAAGVVWVTITQVSDCANWLSGPTGTGNRGGFWPYYTGSEPSATAFCTQMLQDISAQAQGQPTSGQTIDSNGEIRRWFQMPAPWFGLYVSDIIARVTTGPSIAPFNPTTGGACTP